MRVVFDVRPVTRQLAGIGRYCAGLVGELARRADLELIALGDPRTAWDRLPGALRRETLPGGAAWHWRALGRFRELAGDIYHSPSSALVPLWIGSRAVVTVLDLAPIVLPRAATLRTRAGYALLRHAVRRAGAVVCVTHSVSEELAQRWHVRATGVTPLGAPDTATRDGGRSAAASRPYFLVVGTREPRKNLPFVVAAHATARARDPSVPDLLVAGARGWGEDMGPAGAGTGACRILGYIDDRELSALYRGATALIAASRYEGFDLPVLEAMAHGTPVLASSIAAHREVAGDTALWFAPDDAAALVDLLLAAARDPARLAAAAARGRAASAAYTWSGCARETVAVYQKLRAG